MLAVPRISRATSRPGSVPSSASSTCAVDRSASGMSSYARLNDCAALSPEASLEFKAVFRPVSSALRSSRESLCSEVSTSSSCTGDAVWVTLIVSPDFSVGEPGVPGLRSTKKLPSRKMRGRTLAVASSCSGSAESLSSIVSSAALEPSTPVTDLTLPTSTPAIRTGELGRIEFADSNWALTWKPCVNGMSLVKPK